MLINSQHKLTIKNYYMNREQNYYATTVNPKGCLQFCILFEMRER